MKLKEKFDNLDTENVFYHDSDNCEKIADDFAIGFAKWIRKETYYEHLTKEFFYKRNVYESEKELLKIYKEEKKL
jgi:hypothetical protein